MKRSLFLAAILLLIWHSNSYAFLRLGVKAGVNFANVSTSQDSVSYKMTPGYTAGVSAAFGLGPSIGLRGELLYVQRDVKFTAIGQDGKLKLSEWVFAPFLEFRFPTPGGVVPFLQAGPEFGLSDIAKQSYGGQEMSIKDAWKKNNFSVNLGGGIMIPIGNNDLTLDARYNLGLADMTVKGGGKTRTNGIQLFLGYNFLKI